MSESRFEGASRSTGGGRNGQSVAFAHTQLRSAIMNGAIPPGREMTQVGLARELGISRTPLREAVRLLEHEGLVDAVPNRRIRIADFSIADAEGLYATRVALENVAARMTVPKLTPEDFAELEGLMAQMDHYVRTGDIERLDTPHRAFHARFVSAAGSRLTSAIAPLFDHAERYRLAAGAAARSPEEAYPERRAEHRAIIDAAAAGDPQATARSIAIHYGRTAQRVITSLDPRHDPILLRTAVESVDPTAVAVLWPPRNRSRAEARRKGANPWR